MTTPGNTTNGPRFLVRHLGNMGDMVFIVPPVLAALKKEHPNCHITFITSWGYKDKQGRWGKRNQGGHSLHLMMHDPNIDQLIHWHDTALSLDATICHEDGMSFPTWNRQYYESHQSDFDQVVALDFGLSAHDNPVTKAFSIAGLSEEHLPSYQLHLSKQDLSVAKAVMADYLSPRIVLLESLVSPSTRSWDPEKLKPLISAIRNKYHTDPILFGASNTPYYHGKPLTLRQNIATLTLCDVGIGVLSGPLHFAVAVGLPTITLFCEHPIHRAAPAYFNNLSNTKNKHRTLLGPTGPDMNLLKGDIDTLSLTPAERVTQQWRHWSKPGRQSTKSCIAVITVEEIMHVLSDMI